MLQEATLDAQSVPYAVDDITCPGRIIVVSKLPCELPFQSSFGPSSPTTQFSNRGVCASKWKTIHIHDNITIASLLSFHKPPHHDGMLHARSRNTETQ